MAKAQSPTKTAGGPGRPFKGDRKDVLVRFPREILEGIDARATKDGLSRNDAILEATLAAGIFTGPRPKLVRDGKPPIPPKSIASKVTTAKREPQKPGSRLDKKSVGRRVGPAIQKTPAPALDEEAV